MKTKKWIGLPLAAAVSLVPIAGCRDGSQPGELKPLGKNEQAAIKVMFFDDSYFFQAYGSLFISKFPNIDLTVANTQSLYKVEGGVFNQKKFKEALGRFIEEQQPDVLMLDLNQYAEYAAAGKLLDLEPVIKQDKFDTGGIHFAILKQLRDKGEGELYGLSPGFRSRALFYNADLFEKYGVEPPSDSMSWSEVLNLAARFPTQDEEGGRLYGFAFDSGLSLSFLVDRIARAENLREVSPDGKKATITGDGWKQVFETAIQTVNKRAINLASEAKPDNGEVTRESIANANAFSAGRAAMTLGYPYLISDIAQSQATLHPDEEPFRWGIVTEPVGSNERTIGDSFSIDSVFAVNAKSANPRAAWEFVKYISGDDYARAKARMLMDGQLPSRTSYIPEQNGQSLAAFYKLQPGEEKTLGLERAPRDFYSPFMKMLEEVLEAAAAGRKSLDGAMSDIQKRAQAVLDEANAKQREDAAVEGKA